MLKAGYRCKKCSHVRYDVEVREREASEDVVNYAHYVGRKCHEDHQLRRLYCGNKMLDIFIPMSYSGIGFDGPPMTEEQKAAFREQCEQNKQVEP